MSTYQVVAIPTQQMQVPSAYGNNPWYVESTQYIATVLGPNQGSAWVFWSVKIPTAIAAETVTYIRMQDGLDYKVGDGVGMTRTATSVVKFGRSAANFSGTGGGSVVDVTPGTGNGYGKNVVYPLSGYSGQDLRDGSLMVGIAAYANGADPTVDRNNELRFGVLSWTIYTGTSQPGGSPGTPDGRLDYDPVNVNPGRFAGTQFTNTRGVWLENGTGIRTYMSYTFRIKGAGDTWPPIVFAANGLGEIRIDRYYPNNRDDWWYGDCGPLNIEPTCPPGPYTLMCIMQSGDGGMPTIYKTIQFVVRQQGGYLITEF